MFACLIKGLAEESLQQKESENDERHQDNDQLSTCDSVHRDVSSNNRKNRANSDTVTTEGKNSTAKQSKALLKKQPPSSPPSQAIGKDRNGHNDGTVQHSSNHNKSQYSSDSPDIKVKHCTIY